MSKGLTNIQLRLLGFLRLHWDLRGYMPTVREVARNRDWAVATARQHLDVLVKKGYLYREAGHSRREGRVLRLTERGEKVTNG